MNRVEQARSMAVLAHGDQKYGQHPYVVHLDAVASLCEHWGEDAIVIAYLHDAIEDTNLTGAQIEEVFGPTVRGCVEALTDPPGKNRKERKAGAYARLAAIEAGSDLELALVVKAADRLANVRASSRDGRDGNASLLEMYRREHGAFEEAVHRPTVNDALLEEITGILRGSPSSPLPG